MGSVPDSKSNFCSNFVTCHLLQPIIHTSRVRDTTRLLIISYFLYTVEDSEVRECGKELAGKAAV